MTSILNNVAANTALLNLQNTVANLNKIQGQISTGLKIANAADDAAYFSIASTLRSDSNALSAVSDTLNLGNSSLTVASNALDGIKSALSDINTKLVAAAQPGANRTVIQQEITQDQAQLKSIADSANFNGQNFLSVDSSAAGYNAVKSFVSSFSRDSTGAISVGTIDINTANSALFDANPGGYTSADAVKQISTTLKATDTSVLAGTAPIPTGVNGNNYFSVTTNNGQLQINSYTQDAANAGQYFANTINIGAVNTAAGAPVVTETPGLVANDVTAGALPAGDVVGGIDAASVAYNAAAHTLSFQVVENSANTAGQYALNTYTISNFVPATGKGVLDKLDTTTTGTHNGTTVNANTSVFGMDISTLTDDSNTSLATLNAYQNLVNNALTQLNTATSTLGTAQKQITTQASFISSLQTSINDGVGSLVNADLNTVSTRLQALQVQQQLGVQSLSIANQSSQMVLKLFQ